jgi:hypothetical protein
MSNGRCDSNGPANINDAWNGGMAHVDGYIFPCYSCGNPAGQVKLEYFFILMTSNLFTFLGG